MKVASQARGDRKSKSHKAGKSLGDLETREWGWCGWDTAGKLETQGRAGVLVGGQMTWSLTRHSRELQFPSKSLKD